MTEPKDALFTLGVCATCGGKEQYLESSVPFGRTQEVWRIVCKCGIASLRWSVTQIAAARVWNRHIAGHDQKSQVGSARIKAASCKAGKVNAL